MRQFTTFVSIITIISLSNVCAMYINRSDDESSNIMRVFGRSNTNKSGQQSYYDSALERARSLLNNEHFQREKKQSQLTFIVKPGAPPLQHEIPELSGNNSNDPGVIYIQVPAYANHSYSLFLHQAKNNSKNPLQEPSGGDGSLVNGEEGNENTNDESDISQTHPSNEENMDQSMIENEENPTYEDNSDHTHPSQPNQDPYDDQANDGDVEGTSQNTENEEQQFEEGEDDSYHNPNYEMSTSHAEENNEHMEHGEIGDRPSNEEDETNNAEENPQANYGDVNMSTENNDESNVENTGGSEEVTENDDCDEDIDESQDFADGMEHPPTSNEDTEDGNMEANENAQSPLNEDVENDDEQETQNEEENINANSEPYTEHMSTERANDEIVNNNISDQDSEVDASNVNENIDPDNQNSIPDNLENDLNENDDPENSVVPLNHEQGTLSDGEHTEDNADAENALNNEQATATIKPGNQITPVKMSCQESRGQFSSPNSCRKYINCWDGIPFEHHCPPGLFFSEAEGFCDWKHKVDCGERPLDTPVIEGCTGNMYGTFRNPEDCSEYFVCVTEEPTKFKCPDSLNYNENLGVCDHNYRVDCGNSTSSNTNNTTNGTRNRVSPGLVMTDVQCKPDYLWRVGSSCRRVDICSFEGRVQQVRCPTLTAYDFKAKKCIYEGTAKC